MGPHDVVEFRGAFTLLTLVCWTIAIVGRSCECTGFFWASIVIDQCTSGGDTSCGNVSCHSQQLSDRSWGLSPLMEMKRYWQLVLQVIFREATRICQGNTTHDSAWCNKNGNKNTTLQHLSCEGRANGFSYGEVVSALSTSGRETTNGDNRSSLTTADRPQLGAEPTSEITTVVRDGRGNGRWAIKCQSKRLRAKRRGVFCRGSNIKSRTR